MGNHCCASSSAVWAAESMKLPQRPMERDHHHDDHPEYGSSVEGTTGGQVRIRISKKQLEELLNKAAMDASGARKKDQLKVDQALLQRLIDESYDLQIQNQDHDHHFHQRPWKPALQSIPEIN